MKKRTAKEVSSIKALRSQADWLVDLENRVSNLEKMIVGPYATKLFADSEVVVPNAIPWEIEIPAELHDSFLVYAMAFVSTPSSDGNLEITWTNLTTAELMATAIIEEGELSSRTSGTPVVIDDDTSLVSEGDHIGVEVVYAGVPPETAYGLGVEFRFA